MVYSTIIIQDAVTELVLIPFHGMHVSPPVSSNLTLSMFAMASLFSIEHACFG